MEGSAMGESVRAKAAGEIPRHVDDEISAIVYSVIGKPSVEAQLLHHLSLSQNSVRFLGTHLKTLQLKFKELENRYDAVKVEASLSAGALRQKIGEFDTLKAAYDQLVKECELFRNDREIFADAAEDAEERRADADRRALEAERRVLEAEESEKSILKFVEGILKAYNEGKPQAFSSPELKARLAAIMEAQHSDTKLSSQKVSSRSILSPGCLNRSASKKVSSDSKSDSKGQEQNNDSLRTGKVVWSRKGAKVEAVVKSPPKLLLKDSRGTKRVLFDTCRARDEINSVARQKVSKNVLMDRTKLSGTISKVGRLQTCNFDEKENVQEFDADVMAKIQEASESDNETAKFLADLLLILKRNLVRAETEGDLLYAKYCELHKLLMDTLETFGILPDICEARAHLDDT